MLLSHHTTDRFHSIKDINNFKINLKTCTFELVLLSLQHESTVCGLCNLKLDSSCSDSNVCTNRLLPVVLSNNLPSNDRCSGEINIHSNTFSYYQSGRHHIDKHKHHTDVCTTDRIQTCKTVSIHDTFGGLLGLAVAEVIWRGAPAPDSHASSSLRRWRR